MFTVSHDHQMLQCSSRPLLMERSWKPHVETAPNCPRCASSNTKFCYYNNYSFSQPRYFCKGCRRYWTKGGSLRNVPVGGGCRKSRRSKSVRPPPILTNYSCGDLTSSSNTSEDSSAPPDSCTNRPGIDLAMVFAKFLNQNSSFDTELAGLDQLPDAADHVSVNEPNTNHVVIEGQKPSDFVTDDQLDEGVLMAYVDDHNLQQQEQRIPEFPGPDDPNVFGLQALLSDQVVEDALWSDATWQPMAQLQEFDQTLAMNHLMSDSWSSSFDLPSYEVFSRP